MSGGHFMPTPTYSDVLSRAQQLEPADQLRLAEELVARIRRQLSSAGQRSIRELRGLGKEVWEEIDAQAYVDMERDSWDG